MQAALLELGGSHDECLYAQIQFLKESGYTVHLICTANLQKQVADFDRVDQFLFFDFEGAGKLQSFIKLMQIRKYIIRNRITQVIFNTAEGNLVRNLSLLPFPSWVSFSGVIHNAHKLLKSSSQRLISRKVKKYFVLNDYITEQVAANKQVYVESFYPIYFPAFQPVPLAKAPDELWVCIPGQVDAKRRDYEGLLQALKKIKTSLKLRFIILGRDIKPDKRLRDQITAAGLQDMFVLFDSFIPNALFHSYLEQSDVIAPLLHPCIPKFELYQKYKITGSINLAFAYKLPLLVKDRFAHIPDFQENGIFYNLDSLHETLEQLPGLLEKIKPQLYRNPKWAFEQQQQKYTAFIERKV